MYTDDLYRLLRTGHAQLQGIVDTISNPLLVIDAGMYVQAVSRSYLSTFGVERDDTIGHQIYEIGGGQWDIAELRLLLSKVIPKATAIIDFEIEQDFPGIGRRTMLLTARTLYHAERDSHTMLLSFLDATDRTRQNLSKDLLFGEMRHRMKNLISMAQSMARQMPVDGVSSAEYRDAFLGRFAALTDAQELIFTEQEDPGLKKVLEQIFAAYSSDGGIVIEPGEPVDLGSSKITSLSMILHELATNAVKYGALSVSGGKLHVGWQIEDGHRQLRLKWTESGGPAVSPPEATGYGTKLIQSLVKYNLRGTLELSYAATGFHAEIVIPLQNNPSIK